MAAHWDLVIRHGTVIDGSGTPGRQADIAIRDGRIACIGAVTDAGAEEIEASGMLVTPGFIDIHTHYDGQATWSGELAPSTLHGVTTAVMGNCGVGFAPCREADRDGLIRLMEGVEDIPNPVLAEGIPWAWESFPQYFDFLAQRRFDADLAGYVPHAALRTYVMGRRALELEPATPGDIAAMAALLRQALEAGALGIGSSQHRFHKSSAGNYTPTLAAEEAEYAGLADALRESGRGMMQIVIEWLGEWEPRFDMLCRLARRSGRPLSFAMTQNHHVPRVWRDVLRRTAEANAQGLAMSVQVLPRPLGVLLGLELTLNPFYTAPGFAALRGLPLPELVAALRQPEIKARILAEANIDDPARQLGTRVRDFTQLYEFGDPPDYEPEAASSIAAEAARRGVDAASLAYDKLLDQDGRNILFHPFSNYADFSLDPCAEMLVHKQAVPGLGDGGAHLGTICDGSMYTTLLTHWARDRRHGTHLPIEHLVHLATRRGAEAVGLRDRGLLRPGYRADLNVIDFARLGLGKPHVLHDLPAGGRRLMQQAHGYVATIVAGTVVRREGSATGARPGRLVRGDRGDPVA